MAKAKAKKNLTEAEKARLAELDRKNGGRHVMLEGGLIVNVGATQDSEMVAKGWASSVDEITDEMRAEYETEMKKPAKPIRLK